MTGGSLALEILRVEVGALGLGEAARKTGDFRYAGAGPIGRSDTHCNTDTWRSTETEGSRPWSRPRARAICETLSPACQCLSEAPCASTTASYAHGPPAGQRLTKRPAAAAASKGSCRKRRAPTITSFRSRAPR